jgi:hypothetical protein
MKFKGEVKFNPSPVQTEQHTKNISDLFNTITADMEIPQEKDTQFFVTIYQRIQQEMPGVADGFCENAFKEWFGVSIDIETLKTQE